MNETVVTVVGNIASDVISRRVGAEGHVVVGFRVASSERRRDRLTGEWADGDRFSARVSCWRQLGEHVQASLVKGDPVVVTGKLSIREYEVEGERRYSTEVEATAVGPNLARSTARVTRWRALGAESDRIEAAVGTTVDGVTPDGVAPDEDLDLSGLTDLPDGLPEPGLAGVVAGLGWSAEDAASATGDHVGTPSTAAA